MSQKPSAFHYDERLRWIPTIHIRLIETYNLKIIGYYKTYTCAKGQNSLIWRISSGVQSRTEHGPPDSIKRAPPRKEHPIASGGNASKYIFTSFRYRRSLSRSTTNVLPWSKAQTSYIGSVRFPTSTIFFTFARTYVPGAGTCSRQVIPEKIKIKG
jgi:hypothetical protein